MSIDVYTFLHQKTSSLFGMSVWRGRSLALYKQLMRDAVKWDGPHEESLHLQNVIRQEFRENMFGIFHDFFLLKLFILNSFSLLAPRLLKKPSQLSMRKLCRGKKRSSTIATLSRSTITFLLALRPTSIILE
jgi:hypothetical protein